MLARLSEAGSALRLGKCNSDRLQQTLFLSFPLFDLSHISFFIFVSAIISALQFIVFVAFVCSDTSVYAFLCVRSIQLIFYSSSLK